MGQQQKIAASTAGKNLVSPEASVDHHGLSDGCLCVGTHKPVNDARICPARELPDTVSALMRAKPAVPPATHPDARDTPFESERDPISQSIEASLESYTREAQTISRSQPIHWIACSRRQSFRNPVVRVLSHSIPGLCTRLPGRRVMYATEQTIARSYPKLRRFHPGTAVRPWPVSDMELRCYFP